MPKLGFSEALDQVVAADPKFDREAYLFLRDALDFTIKSRKKQRSEISRHVSGQELLEGVRLYALQEFGPMVPTVFETWNIQKCGDVGEMVFNLIKGGIFDKTENDSIDDFADVYDFHDAFVKPYLPEKPYVDFRTQAQETAEEPSSPSSPKPARRTTKGTTKSTKAKSPAKGTKSAAAKAKKAETPTPSDG